MSRQIDFLGKSGTNYRYTALEEDRFLPPAGANFVIAEVTGEGARLVYVGETDNLANQTWRTKLDAARKKHPEAKVLTRLNVTRAIREAERSDLVEQHQPPMNRDGRA